MMSKNLLRVSGLSKSMKKRSSNRPRRTYAGSSRSGLLAVATTKTGAFLSAIHERIEPPIRAETPLSLEPSPPEPASNFSISSPKERKVRLLQQCSERVKSSLQILNILIENVRGLE